MPLQFQSKVAQSKKKLVFVYLISTMGTVGLYWGGRNSATRAGPIIADDRMVG
jgi:hypothetical protein